MERTIKPEPVGSLLADDLYDELARVLKKQTLTIDEQERRDSLKREVLYRLRRHDESEHL